MEINPLLYNAPMPPTPTPDKNANDAKLREQTDAFEALILKVFLDSALELGDGVFPKQTGSEIYNSMYKTTLAESLSGGFGYSDLLFNYLKDLQKNG